MFRCVSMKGSVVAHELAKLSFSFDELRVWMEEAPPEINSFVLLDSYD